MLKVTQKVNDNAKFLTENYSSQEIQSLIRSSIINAAVTPRVTSEDVERLASYTLALLELMEA